MPDDVLDATKDIPQDLLKAMQEPLIRWWTIAVLATTAQQYLPLFIKIAKGVRNMTTTKETENTIMSNLCHWCHQIGLLWM
jgi:hypothetical protein